MRYYVTYTIPLYVGVSSSPAKRKGPTRKLWARRFTRSSLIVLGKGASLLKFICGQLHYGKLAMRYGHVPTNE